MQSKKNIGLPWRCVEVTTFHHRFHHLAHAQKILCWFWRNNSSDWLMKSGDRISHFFNFLFFFWWTSRCHPSTAISWSLAKRYNRNNKNQWNWICPGYRLLRLALKTSSARFYFEKFRLKKPLFEPLPPRLITWQSRQLVNMAISFHKQQNNGEHLLAGAYFYVASFSERSKAQK